MDKTKENAKNYSGKLYTFFALNCIVFIMFALPGTSSISDINEIYNSYFAKSGIVLTSASFVVFILNGLITPDFKAKLVFWQKNNVYPGFRVFTDLLVKDPRIDKAILEKAYGELPKMPIEQNQLWYKIYKRYEFQSMIFNSHRNFLFSRDLTGFSFLFMCVYPISTVISIIIFGGSFSSLLWYLVFLVTQFIICSLVGRNYGNRFACNVLAQASSVENGEMKN